LICRKLYSMLTCRDSIVQDTLYLLKGYSMSIEVAHPDTLCWSVVSHPYRVLENKSTYYLKSESGICLNQKYDNFMYVLIWGVSLYVHILSH
jgi:hypothetical protein